MKRIFGGLMLLLGIALAGWIGYNYLIKMQPEAREINPAPAILFSLGLLFVGGKWLRQ